MSDRDCNKCVYSTRDGNCRKWDCEGTKTVADIKAEAIDEFCEKLLNKAVNDSFLVEINGITADCMTVDYLSDLVFEVTEQLKVGEK